MVVVLRRCRSWMRKVLQGATIDYGSPDVDEIRFEGFVG